MKKRKPLKLLEIIDRSLLMFPEEVRPLAKYLDITSEVRIPSEPGAKNTKNTALKISNYLREMGSNDIATLFRGGDGVEYKEVVQDAAEKVGANPTEGAPAYINEKKLLIKMFADALDTMSEEERRTLFQNLNLSEGEIPIGAAGVLVSQILIRQFGGFAVYQMAVIVANIVSRALLRQGLSVAANAAVTRAVGTFLGPVGWFVSGAWLLVDLAGPAYRKTIPAVLHVAYLRMLLEERVTIGIVGDGSAGKDSLLNAVFGINSGNIDPVAGSTSEAQIYELEKNSGVQLINYPGFNDYRKSVSVSTEDLLHHTDIFLLVVDVSRGASNTDIDIFKKVSRFERPVLVCANKVDLPRPSDKEKLLSALQSRMKAKDFIETSFDPDSRISGARKVGVSDVRTWIIENLEILGKNSERIKVLK